MFPSAKCLDIFIINAFNGVTSRFGIIIRNGSSNWIDRVLNPNEPIGEQALNQLDQNYRLF